MVGTIMASLRHGPVSVVIASIVGPPFIDDCIRSIETEARQLSAEVIVVACGTAAYAGRIAGLFPWVKVIHCPERETVPNLRARGVEAAQADVVAIIEEHCVAAKDWLRQTLAGLEHTEYAAVGGPVVDHAYERLRDWVVYFCEYNGYLPPARNGEVWDLNGANVAYRRPVLMANRELMYRGYWEASLHPVLLAAGVRFLSMPGMVVHHRGPFDYIYYLKQRYWFSRAFAGHRSKNLPLTKKLVYSVAVPLVPLLLFARMTKRVFDKRCRLQKFAQVIPLLLPALTVYVAGEWVGYVAGPGNALTKVE
jgi:glycosyltransferase involved in cell wall biosynthesis